MKKVLVLLAVFVQFILIQADGCVWSNNPECGTELISSLFAVPDCWTCPAGQTTPNVTDSLSLSAPDVTAVYFNEPVSIFSLSINGATLTVENMKFTVHELSVTGASVTLKNVIMQSPYEGNQVTMNVQGSGVLKFDSVNTSVILNAGCTTNFTGASNLFDSQITLLKDSFFIGNKNGYSIDVGGARFENYGKATFCEPANPVFEIRGTQLSDNWYNRAGSMITIGQSPVYGEVDMNLLVSSEAGSSIVVNANKLFAPERLLSSGNMFLTGSLRLEYGMVALLERANLSPDSTGSIEVYGDGMVGFSKSLILPLATLNIAAGGTIEVIGVDGNQFADMKFKYVSVVDGEIQNNPDNLLPIPARVAAETITLVNARINMFNDTCALTISGDNVYIGQKLNLLDYTVVLFTKGAIQLEANISGSSLVDQIEFQAASTVTMYFWGYKWNHTEVKISGKIDFHALEDSAWTGTFVDASTSNITLTGATVGVHLNTPPKRWGDFSLISTTSPIIGAPASITIDGDYSCLGATVLETPRGLILRQQPPAMAAPSNLNMVNSGTTTVIRFDGVATLPCYMKVVGYTVAVGNDTYDIAQRALVADASLFPACQIFQAQAALRVMTNFTPSLTATGPMSTPLSFANIPPPPTASDLLYQVSDDQKSVTIKFGATAASVCGCSSLQSRAYYQVIYHGKTTNSSDAQVTLQDISNDDADVVIKTVCEYNLDPRVVTSSSTTRISAMNNGDTIVKNNNDLSGGQIAGVVLGLAACFAVGIVIGVLVAKRSFTRMNNQH